MTSNQSIVLIRDVINGTKNASGALSKVTKSAIYNTGTLTFDEYQSYNTIFTWIKVIGHPLSLTGIILSIVIFARKSMRNSSTVFLIALNLAEAYSVTTLFLFQACNLDKDCSDNWFYAHFKLYSTTYLGLVSQRSVYVYNCLVTVQRFLVVAFPVRFKTILLFNKPLPLCICVLILSLIMHTYLPLRYAVVNRNGSHVVTDSQLALSYLSTFNALSSTSMYVLVYAPLLVGTISSVAMCVAMRRQAQITRRVSSNRGDRRRKEISSGILVSTFLFFTLSLPSNINQLVSMNTEHYGNLRKEYYLYQTLSGAFVVVQVFRDLVIFLSFICASPTFRHHLFNIVTLERLRRLASRASKNESIGQSPVTQVSVIMECSVRLGYVQTQQIKQETNKLPDSQKMVYTANQTRDK